MYEYLLGSERDDMAVEHGSRTKYNAGCRCDDCKKASRDYDKIRRQRMLANKHSRANVTTLPGPAQTGGDAAGSVEAGVMAEIGSLSTVGRQGLVQIAIALAKVLDSPLAIAQHPSAAHRLSETLDKLRKGADGKSGRLAAVRSMTRSHEATG